MCLKHNQQATDSHVYQTENFLWLIIFCHEIFNSHIKWLILTMKLIHTDNNSIRRQWLDFADRSLTGYPTEFFVSPQLHMATMKVLCTIGLENML
jgi:hypothetical protein